MGNPLNLQTVVNSGETLNVGNADLFNITWGMIFSPQATPAGILMSSAEQGSWTYDGPTGCGGNPVTVNANIEANWDSGPGWNWWDLQKAFATALWAVMQAVSGPTGYENYSYTEFPEGDTVVCEDPQFLDWGHYIPAAILVTAYNSESGTEAGHAKVTYSTGDQSGGDICGTIAELNNVLAIFPLTAPLASVVGAVTGLFCG